MSATIYKDIFGWTDFTQLYEDMVNKYDNTYFCEIGCFKGKSTVFLGETIKSAGKNIKVVAVDLWPNAQEIEQYAEFGAGQSTEGTIIREKQESLMQEFVDNLNKADLRDIVFPIRSFSDKAASIFPDEYFSFIFVDAGHEYDHVIKDLNAWFPKLKQNGVIAGHDFDTPSVNKAVRDFFQDKTQDTVELICQRSWIWRNI